MPDTVRCTTHDGRHLRVWGQCVHPGARYAVSVRPCPDCGQTIATRRHIATGHTERIAAGSDAEHVCVRPVVVTIDEASFARAIVAAAAETREQRRSEARR